MELSVIDNEDGRDERKQVKSRSHSCHCWSLSRFLNTSIGALRLSFRAVRLAVVPVVFTGTGGVAALGGNIRKL